MTIVGIDPGEKGGVAWTDGVSHGARPLPYLGGRPDLAALEDLLVEVGADAVFIELPQIRPKESGGSALTIGTNWGLIVGLVTGLRLRRVEVAASAWKRRMGVDVKAPKGKGEDETDEQKAARATKARKERKDKAVQTARSLFPGVSLLPTPKSRVPSDGLAEALLIAEYGRREMMGERGKSGS